MKNHLLSQNNYTVSWKKIQFIQNNVISYNFAYLQKIIKYLTLKILR
jgi:hypothetical protein